MDTTPSTHAPSPEPSHEPSHEPQPFAGQPAYSGTPAYSGPHPYAAPYGYAGPPAPYGSMAPRHRGSRLRWGLVGAVAGGVLAAAVAVPVTLQLADQGAANSAASGPAAGTGNGTLPGGLPGTLPGGGDGSGDSGSGGFGTVPGANTQATGTAASEAQSKGVLLVESRLTNGAGAGTAMVLDSSGLALTNYHVVEGSTEPRATVATTGETYEATVVGFDENADVALIQLKDASGLDTVSLDQDGTSVGEAVTGVGNALGQGRLLAAAGKITAEDQSITTSEGAGSAAATEDLTGLLETDAAVVPGYSGGPMYDADGEVVGISTAASSNNGSAAATGSTAADSFAVPIGDAMEVVDQIQAGNESGDVQIGPSPYLGIGAADGTNGVAVEQVEAGTGAAQAGLVLGDTITAVDGTKVTTLDELLALLADHEPGDSVKVTWTTSDGATRSATITLGESPVN
jgi:S1-C subfamily serine protease